MKAVIAISALALLVATPAALAGNPLPDVPPLVGVCIEGVTHSGCYRGNWLCVTVSLQVPQCIQDPPQFSFDLCHVGNVCAFVEDTFHLCYAGVTEARCYGDHDLCVEISDMVPICYDAR